MKLTDKEFYTLVDLFKTRFGINLTQKRVLVEGRLINTLKQRGIESFQQYIDIVLKDSSGVEMETLVNKITTNHTYFMREPEHFQFLKEHILPYLEQKRTNRTLRIWSAGCSSGEEAYTLAMCIDEYFGSRKKDWDTVILASDISTNVLNKAKAATYPMESMQNISAPWQHAYFMDNKNGTVSVQERIKKEVIFKPINLMSDFTFRQPFDLICCRNVMIYFDKDAKERLVQRYCQYTANDGFLFIGHSETITTENTEYQIVRPAIYRKGR